jgi:hypothetical protein
MRPTASLWLFTAMNGFVTANAISGALADFPMRAGAVSALMGAIQYGSGVAGSAVAGTFADGTPWPNGMGDRDWWRRKSGVQLHCQCFVAWSFKSF